MALEAEKIVLVALDLLKTYGLGDVTMRRVAQELGVQPGALYWHFKNKQSLLVALGNLILIGLEARQAALEGVGQEMSWWHRAIVSFEQLSDLRDSAEVLFVAIGAGGRATEELLKECFKTQEGPHVLGSEAVLASLILGHVMQYQARVLFGNFATHSDAAGLKEHFTAELQVFLQRVGKADAKKNDH